MNTIEQIITMETEGPEPDEEIELIQKLINSGDAWKLQGSYGRHAMELIEQGLCMLGNDEHRDAYGGHVPNRGQVQPGTKGSYQYVVDKCGESYARRLSTL